MKSNRHKKKKKKSATYSFANPTWCIIFTQVVDDFSNCVLQERIISQWFHIRCFSLRGKRGFLLKVNVCTRVLVDSLLVVTISII